MSELMAHHTERRGDPACFGLGYNISLAKARQRRLCVRRRLPSNNSGILGVKDGPDISVRWGTSLARGGGFIAVARMNNNDGVEGPCIISPDQTGFTDGSGD